MGDEAAEKTIGLFDDLTKQEKVSLVAAQFKPEKFEDQGKMRFAASSLAAEKAFQKYNEFAYKAIKDMGELTLGLDDLIMEQASKSEVHAYLLKQILKSGE